MIPNFRTTFMAFQSTPSVGRATKSKPTHSAVLIIFQSTPSVGRATEVTQTVYFITNISIHALRGEGDLNDAYNELQSSISIHALRGEGDY